MTTALLTDHYELTMVRAALRSGTAHRPSVFEVFARALPQGRRYGVVAGAARLTDALRRFTFSAHELSFLSSSGVIDDLTADYLASYRFTGSIWGYGEGECYFPGSPILVVESTFAEAVLLETLVLSILNHDCAIASAASRMVNAAGGRPIIEMGGRRTHELAAVAAARAAYIAGFVTTSNLRAGHDYQIPTAGTASHAFTLVHDGERSAFAAQLDALGTGTTLLVDTFDVEAAVRVAVELAGPDLGAVRIDSGNLPEQAVAVRALLDSLGATKTKIVITGDLDEYAIADLAATPSDAYGVGTALVTGSGAPTAGLVYKLVARSHPPGTSAGGSGPSGSGPLGSGVSPERRAPGSTASPQGSTARLLPVAKRSAGKQSRGGRKWAARRLDATGTATAEVVSAEEIAGSPGERPLLRELVRDGQIVPDEPLQAARERHRQALAELPPSALRLSAGGPTIPTLFLPRELCGRSRPCSCREVTQLSSAYASCAAHRGRAERLLRGRLAAGGRRISRGKRHQRVPGQSGGVRLRAHRRDS